MFRMIILDVFRFSGRIVWRFWLFLLSGRMILGFLWISLIWVRSGFWGLFVIRILGFVRS